jgi:hypothetical protein
MPTSLFADDEVNEMLCELEDIMLAPRVTVNVIGDGTLLDWRPEIYKPFERNIKDPQLPLPLPVLGLEFTLGYYFPTTPINLSTVESLYLDKRRLPGNCLLFSTDKALPTWLSKMPNLKYLRVCDTDMNYVPAWITNMKNLHSIMTTLPQSPNTPYSPEKPPRLPRLRELVSSKIREFVETGGDWRDLEGLEPHLMEGIITSMVLRKPDLLPIGYTCPEFVVQFSDRSEWTGRTGSDLVLSFKEIPRFRHTPLSWFRR